MTTYLHLIIIFLLLLEGGFSKDNWRVLKTSGSNNKQPLLHIQNISTNEERVTSERRRGNLNIIVNQDKIALSVDWGEFANFSDANIYYYLNNYGLWEENWAMSKNGERSYSPDPLLLLMQLTTTDSLAIGIRPKYSNEIRYYFNNKGLSEIIRKNQKIFGQYSDLIKNVFNDSSSVDDKTYLKSKLQSFISSESDTRTLRVSLFENDKFFFKPIWYESKLISSHHLNSNSNNIIYFNRWLKKKGTLFTDNDIRVTKIFTNKPKIIQYTDIHNVEVKGNMVTGYRIHINDKYFTSFSKIKKNQAEEIKNFILNRSKYSSKG